MGVARLDSPVYHQDVTIEDSGIDHRVAACTQEVSRLRMLDQKLGQINPLGTQVLGR